MATRASNDTELLGQQSDGGPRPANRELVLDSDRVVQEANDEPIVVTASRRGDLVPVNVCRIEARPPHLLQPTVVGMRERKEDFIHIDEYNW